MTPLAPIHIELWRKAIHVTTGLVPLAYALWLSRPQVVLVLGVMLASMLLTEWLRRAGGWPGRLFQRIFGFMLRDHEQTRLLGATHYVAGSFLCVLIFPKQAAVLAMLYLAIGDTAASLVGMTIGRIRIGRKSLEGMLAFWLASSAVALAVHGFAPEYPLVPALLAAPVAALVEAFVHKVDDNWTVPLASGLTISLLMLVFVPA